MKTENSKLIKTDKVTEEDVILVPILKDFEGREYFQAISYEKEINLVKKSNIENTEIIKEIISSKYTNKKLSDFNWSFFLNPNYSDLVVIDFDDYETTLNKIDFLCENNPEFKIKWLVFKNELLDKTFKVQTPSGGFHYYIKRPSRLIKERIVGSIDVKLNLPDDKFKEFKEKFKNDSASKTKSKIKIDYLPKGVVNAPGITLRNVKKKDEVKDRTYTIVTNLAIKEVTPDLEHILCYLFAEDESRSKEDRLRKIHYTRRNRNSIDIEDIITNVIELEKKLENIKEINKTLPKIIALKDKISETRAKFATASTKQLIRLKANLEGYYYDIDQVEQKNIGKVEKQIKDLLCSNLETEYIYNINYKFDIATTLFNRNKFHVFPPTLLSKVNSAKEGYRSEIEMAFITNLKVRNFSDTYIRYIVQKHFSAETKCKKTPNFLNQSLQVADMLRKYPHYLNNEEADWIQILQSICIIREIDFKQFSSKNSEKMRIALDALFNIASVNNDLTIKTNLKDITLLSNGRLNNQSLKEYITIFEKFKIIEDVEWMDYYENKKAYPQRFTLKSLTEVKKLKKLPIPRYLPQDGNQALTYIPFIGEFGMQIIEILRQYGVLTAPEIYTHFTEMKDHRRVIYKKLQALLSYEVVIFKFDKYELSGKSFNVIYDTYVKKAYKNEHDYKREKAKTPLIRKIINYREEALFIQKSESKKKKKA